MTNNKLLREDELILLANWSIGKNREDIGDIEPSLFIRKDIYKLIVEGNNPTQIASLGKLGDTSISELMELATGDFNRSQYIEAKTNALMLQRSVYADKLKKANSEETKAYMEEILRTEALLSGEKFQPLATNYGDNYLNYVEEIQEEKNPHYGTGFKWVDVYTDGIHRGQLTVLGARPRVGKSALALQIAYNVAYRQNYKVLFLPLEMTVNECLERILLQTQTVDPKFRKQPLTDENKELIKGFLDGLEDNLKFCTTLNRLDDIEKAIKAEKPYLIIIDQTSQLKTTSKRKDVRETYIEISRELKRLALEHDIAIIALHQMNRANADNWRPSIEALAESDSLARDADNVFMLYTKNDEEEGDNPSRLTYLNLAKQRNGVSGKEITLMFSGERFTFSPVDYTYKE